MFEEYVKKIKKYEQDLLKFDGDVGLMNKTYVELKKQLWKVSNAFNLHIKKDIYPEDKKYYCSEAIKYYFRLLEIIQRTTGDKIEMSHIHHALATNYLFLANLQTDGKYNQEIFQYNDLAYREIKMACELDSVNFHHSKFKEIVMLIFLKLIESALENDKVTAIASLNLNKVLLELCLERNDYKYAATIAHRISSIYYDHINDLYFKNEYLLDDIKISYSYIEKACELDPSYQVHQERCTHLRNTFIKILNQYILTVNKSLFNELSATMLLLDLQLKNRVAYDKEADICHAIASLHMKIKSRIKNDPAGRVYHANLAFEFAKRAYSLDSTKQLNIYLNTCEALADALRGVDEEKSVEMYNHCLQFSVHSTNIDFVLLSYCHNGLAAIFFDRSSRDEDIERNLELAKYHYENVLYYKAQYERLTYPDQSIHMLIVTLLDLGLHYEKRLKQENSTILIERIRILYLQALDLAVRNDEPRKLAIVENRIGHFLRHHGDIKNAYLYHQAACSHLMPYLMENNLVRNSASILNSLNTPNLNPEEYRIEDDKLIDFLKHSITEGTIKRKSKFFQPVRTMEKPLTSHKRTLESDGEDEDYSKSARKK